MLSFHFIKLNLILLKTPLSFSMIFSFHTLEEGQNYLDKIFQESETLEAISKLENVNRQALMDCQLTYSI